MYTNDSTDLKDSGFRRRAESIFGVEVGSRGESADHEESSHCVVDEEQELRRTLEV
jgi:hypothetical protein